MSTRVEYIQTSNSNAWDAYVRGHPKATHYHLFGWKNVIERTYGHKTYYLMATKNTQRPVLRNQYPETNTQKVCGVLPLVHLKHFIFGNALVSMPFLDYGGLLAGDEEAEKSLLSEAMRLCLAVKGRNVELRHIQPLQWLNDGSKLRAKSFKPVTIGHQLSAMSYITRSHKVRMVLPLPGSSDALMTSFRAKLRSQIRKPIKEGLTSKIGGLELLHDFYSVFSSNMRDLGSPVHSDRLMTNVLHEFAKSAKFIIIYMDTQPVACSLVVGFGNTLENPWASSLRKFSRLSPNMLLYWTMLEYACDNEFVYFDFGRSSPFGSTYKFKEQWGAKPTPLHWHYFSVNGGPIDDEASEKVKFEKLMQYWRKLPVSVTKIVGPMIRKHIGL